MHRWGQALGCAVAFLSLACLRPGATTASPTAGPEFAEKAHAEAIEVRTRVEHPAELDALARACSAGTFTACHDLGLALESGGAVPRDLGRAAELYRQACDHGVDASCFNLGLMYEVGKGVEQDASRAARLYVRACDLNHMKACDNAAYLYLHGIGVPANPVVATELYWRACRSRYAMACANLANIYRAGAGVTKNLGRSLRLMVRACRGLFMPACEELDDELPKLVGRVQVHRPTHPKDEIEWFDQRDLQARLALAAGHFEQARQRLSEALARLPDRDLAGASDVLYLVLLNSRTYDEQGQFGNARRALEDRLKLIDASSASVRNAYFLMLIVRLSVLEERAGAMLPARDHLRRELALEVELRDGESTDLARGYAHLGRLCDAVGDSLGALEAFNKSWAIADHIGNEELAAASLNNIGAQLMFTGEYRRAADNFERALSIRRRAQVPDDSVIGQNLGNLSFAYGALEDWPQAISYQRQYLDSYVEDIGRRVVLGDSIVGSPSEKELEREWVGALSWTITLDVLTDGRWGSRELAAASVAELHGFRTEQLRDAIGALRTSRPSTNSSIIAALRHAQQDLSAAYYVQPRSGESWPDALSNAQSRLSAAEARAVETGATDRHPGGLTDHAVRGAVPPQSALIVYVPYYQVDARARTAAGRDTGPMVTAYVFRRDRPTTFVNLGPLDRIKDQRESALWTIMQPLPGYTAQLRKLHKLVLEPIEPFVAGTEELVVVPGELLAAVPFEALVDANEKFVIESRRVRYVSGATELVELANAARPRTADLSSAVVVAAPDYSSGPGLALDSGHRVHFNALPGAAAEGEAVARRLGSSENLVSGRRATTSFLLELQGPPVLHIASHSFFLTSGSTPAAMAEMLRVASASRKSEPGTYELEVSEPAMVRAGVVLAGANGGATIHAGGQAYDGILTALNFAGVDLRETQLVVLSACETGVGHATLGEGLDGMRTALRIAGARTRVLSLWEVDDCATRQFMEEWYRRMVAGEDRIDALRSVKLDMLRGLLQPTAECAVQSAALTSTGDRKQGWSHPNFWAPFVAEGASGRL